MSKQDPEEMDKQIAVLMFQRDSLRVSQSLAGKLAILLHDHFCEFNHTDGCSWGYECKGGYHEWESPRHKSWLIRAREVIEKAELEK